MKINYLTTAVGNLSGGAIYDSNFLMILKNVYKEVSVYDDEYFKKRCNNRELDLIHFNIVYKDCINDLFNCDYLVMNSRLYTRLLLINIKSIAKRYKHVKLVVIHHHNNYMNNKGIKRVVHEHYELALLRAATELIIPNKYVIDSLKKVKKIPSIKYLPSSFEGKEHTISNLRNRIVLFVGTVEPRKGLKYGIQAFSILHEFYPKYKYIIAGRTDADVSYYNKLKRFVLKKNLQNSVVFEGRVSDMRLDELYSHADIFLFPSLLEGYGWVMIEAMGRGIPVLAFNNSAMPYTIKDGFNGRLIENKNWRKMGRELVNMVENISTMKHMQMGALKTYKSVSLKEELDKMTLEYVMLWEAL